MSERRHTTLDLDADLLDVAARVLGTTRASRRSPGCPARASSGPCRGVLP